MIHLFRSLLNVGSGILSILVYVTLIIELIFMLTMPSFNLFYGIHYYIFLLLFFDSLIRLIIRPTKSFGYKRLTLGLLAILPILSENGIQFSIDMNLGLQQIILLLIAVSRIQHLSFLFEPLRSNPTQTFIGGFTLFILVGAIFLMIPTAHRESIAFIDALFIAASAVCVTGLSVFDIGTVLTPFGQIILLILIQIGGLGIMTFYALITISLNQRFLSSESKELQDGWSTESMKETFGLIRSIFSVTIIVELIGACLIYISLSDHIQDSKLKIFYSFFHSVSAFCNAGFSLFPDSIALFSTHSFMIIVFSILIFLGGIGFPVIFELYHRYIVKDRHRLKLQTKMVLYVSLSLIIIGALIIFFQSLFSGNRSPSILMALFHSISARTAGFSMQDISLYSTASLWFMLILMFIGASPGSTGVASKPQLLGY